MISLTNRHKIIASWSWTIMLIRACRYRAILSYSSYGIFFNHSIQARNNANKTQEVSGIKENENIFVMRKDNKRSSSLSLFFKDCLLLRQTQFGWIYILYNKFQRIQGSRIKVSGCVKNGNIEWGAWYAEVGKERICIKNGGPLSCIWNTTLWK